MINSLKNVLLLPLQLLNRPFDLYEHSKMTLRTDSEIQDVIAVVDGLIDVSR